MKRKQVANRSALLFTGLLGLGLGGCGKGEAPVVPEDLPPVVANRGLFVDGSCPVDKQIAIPSDAAFAIYFDVDGNELQSVPVEDLAGTKDMKLCSAEAPIDAETTPGICTPLCEKKVGTRTFCRECPT